MNLIETPYLLEEKVKSISKVLQFDRHQMMNIQLRVGEQIQEHYAKEYVLIVVRKGKVAFMVDGIEQIVTANNILYMDPLENHALTAIEDSDILVIKIGK